MLNKKILAQSLAVVGLLAATGAAQATITVYTSLAAFNAAVLNPGTDTFQGISLDFATPSPLARSAGDYGYQATTEITGPTGGFFGAGTLADTWLSTNTVTDTMEFGSFTGGVGAVGGSFFGSNFDGDFVPGFIIVSATDGVDTISRELPSATLDGFLGFVSSSGSIVSLSFSAPEDRQPVGGGFVWPTVNNLVLAAVPEPETYALLLAGLGIVGFMARRRHAD